MFKEAQQQVSQEEAACYIKQLNLNYIVDVMCDEYYPLPRWHKADALKCSQLYKNFLFLQKKHSSMPLVPTREIDEFWHNHILYTQNYFQDCLKIFGYYLHHQPASPTENPDELVKGFLKTKELYFEEFKKPLKIMVVSQIL